MGFAWPLQAEWVLESSTRLSPETASVTSIQKKVSDGQTIELRLILFNPKKCGLRVFENQGGDNLADGMKKNGGLAGVNGNYFGADRSPIGLVICDGKVVHPLEHAKLLSGLVTVSRDQVSLLRIPEYRPESKVTQALQAGPFLVDRGVPVSGLNDTRRAERTVVLSDGAGHAALLICCAPVTLAEMARILCSPGILTELHGVRALNLDGGSSTGLWVKEPPYYRRELKTVANFLAVCQTSH